MIEAFCPAHITCFFQPVDSWDLLKKGSRGAGIRLCAGATVRLDKRHGPGSKVLINGKNCDAVITRTVLREFIPQGGFLIDITNELPIGQGFGMSAAGAVATALCACDIVGKDRKHAFDMAHLVEVMLGGGLGDVSGLMCEGHQPLRVQPGMVVGAEDTGIEFDRLTVAVLGQPIDTGSILSDSSMVSKISEAGARAMAAFEKDATKESLFSVSNMFSAETGLESEAVTSALKILNSKGIDSAMCMLGNSIFIDAGEDEVRSILGDKPELYSCSSTARPAEIIRKG